MYIKLVAINGRFTHSSLALFHVRNELEDHLPEVDTEIHQMTIRDPAYEVLLRLSKDSPDAIFFSAAVWNSELVAELLLDLHTLLPSCQLVVGGPQAVEIGNALPEGVCTVVSGAIEAVQDVFYHDLEAGILKGRYGRSFFHLDGNKERFISPYRAGDFESHLQNRNIYYESSRGCPFSCTYCLSSVEAGTLHKGLDQVRQELDQIMAHDVKVLRFVDRTFNDLPGRALALWELLLSYEAETLFHFEIAPDRITEEMFQFLARVSPGRFQFEIGIQSTHDATLRAIKRRIDPRLAHDTVSRLAALDTIHLHADLILGLPYETKQSYLQSFSDIFAMGPHFIQMGLLKMLPNTELTLEAEAYSYLSCRRPPYSVLASQWLDSKTLQHLYWFSECVEKFYNNRYFPSLWRYFRREKKDISSFFMILLERAQEARLFELAPTQEFLGNLLRLALQERADSSLTEELLIYDWLRCGQRKLPLWLDSGGKGGRQLQNFLYLHLPQEMSGLYSSKGRNRFLKQTIFYQFSGKCLQELGKTEDGKSSGCLAFMLEREDGLMRLQRVVLLGGGLVNPRKDLCSQEECSRRGQ